MGLGYNWSDVIQRPLRASRKGKWDVHSLGRVSVSHHLKSDPLAGVCSMHSVGKGRSSPFPLTEMQRSSPPLVRCVSLRALGWLWALLSLQGRQCYYLAHLLA